MFVNKHIEININPSNYNHYKKFYNNIKVKDIISIDINHLTKGSHVKIDVKCDKCSKIKNIDFSTYSKKFNNGDYICRSCNMKINNQKKYGVDNVFQIKEIKEKSKKTLLEKYGVDNISKSDEIKLKKIKTNNNNFGVNWPMKNEKIKEKSKKTLLKKYKVDNISKSDEIKIKKENTCLNNYGVKYISQDSDFKNYIKNNILNKLKEKYKNLIDIDGDNYIFYCNQCDKNFSIYKKSFYTRYNLNVNLCTICNPIGNFSISGQETELFKFINELNFKIIRNNRKIISPYELDIYIPELKIAFEFNGLYWHDERHKGRNYHLNKTELCEEKGIQLIHIYEDDWLYNQDIVKSMILNNLNKTPNIIHSDKTVTREITDNKIVREFFDKNHIQGYVKSNIKVGLFYNNELISLMIFSKKKYKYELLKYCDKLNTKVIDSNMKLFNYFIDKYNPNKIITYVDRSYSNGNLYEKMNFKLNKKTKPNIKSNKKNHKIYDSGNLKYIYKKSQ